MKKVFCIYLALILCLSICGCQKYNPRATLPSLSDDEKKTVHAENLWIRGTVIGTMTPDVLVLKVDGENDVKTFGETIYVITDQSDDFCVDDRISVLASLVERPNDTSQHVRVTATKIRAGSGGFEMAKPIIYLYPEAPTVCSVKLTIDGKLTCTYPAYGKNGWDRFTANPDGTLIFPDGKEYYALYWEGISSTPWDFSQGFCVSGKDTATFLEWALAEQGLTPREANEFIIYWLPLMQEHPYNVISFQTTAYTNSAALQITPTPDSLLRIFMAYYPTDTKVDMKPQVFDSFTRQGFTVVEWGGSQVAGPTAD